MSTSHSNDRVSRCCFTFADGRQCRMPRKSGHPFLCCFHARREAQAQAAEEVGRDIRFFLSGDYLSAGDLSLALGRVFTAAARGQLKPKTAGTLAYLGQTLLQTIHHAENEYINAFSTDRWRRIIHSHVNENSNYLFPAPPLAEAPLPSASPMPGQTQQQLPVEAVSQSPGQPVFVEAGLEPGLSYRGRASAERNSFQARQKSSVSNHASVPAERSSSPTDPTPSAVSEPPYVAVAPPVQESDATAMTDQPPVSSSSPTSARLPRRAAEFATTILDSVPSCLPPVIQTTPPRSAGFTPVSTPEAAASPTSARQSGAASSDPLPTSNPKPAPAPPNPNCPPLTTHDSLSSSASSQPSPQPTQPSDLPGFGAPANWEVLLPQTRGAARRRRPAYRGRQIRPSHLPE